MTILARIADWLRGSERGEWPDGYNGLTGSEKFEALTGGGTYSRARKIMDEVEAECADHKPVEKPE
ncbi:MAG: hypothetical protein J0J06_13485 [Sphingomonas sp.]|uniref:hypothetical protein n=1 Tax=Sphingomonas sp. TaxID=28214 RepID=UPI001AC0C58D|nr:hypothetical protein [Sphingomonas sp.]MBN8816446.1 hypothetical protein [Sphingomonas sp.]